MEINLLQRTWNDYCVSHITEVIIALMFVPFLSVYSYKLYNEIKTSVAEKTVCELTFTSLENEAITKLWLQSSTKYLAQSKEIKLTWTELQKFVT